MSCRLLRSSRKRGPHWSSGIIAKHVSSCEHYFRLLGLDPFVSIFVTHAVLHSPHSSAELDIGRFLEQDKIWWVIWQMKKKKKKFSPRLWFLVLQQMFWTQIEESRKKQKSEFIPKPLEHTVKLEFRNNHSGACEQPQCKPASPC